MRDTIASKRARHGPLANAVTNMARRAVASLIRRVDRGQFSAHEGEVFDDVPIYQMAGFASFPAAGQFVKAILVALGGSTRNYVAVASSTKEGRPDMVAGDTATFNAKGAHVIEKANGDIVIRCYPGQKVYIDDGSGAVPLATKADLQAVVDELETFRAIYNAHTHICASVGNPSAVPVALHGTPTPASYPSPAGTSVLLSK